MKIVKYVLKRHSADRKKLKELNAIREELERVLNAGRGDIRDPERIDDKVREIDRQIKFVCSAMIRQIFDDILDEDDTSTASSSNSEWPEDETLSTNLNGEAQKQTVVGQGGIGRTKIINSNSKIEYRYENVQITENNYYQSRRSKRKEEDDQP